MSNGLRIGLLAVWWQPRPGCLSQLLPGSLPDPQLRTLSRYSLADYLILNSQASTFFFFQRNLAKKTKELFLVSLWITLSSAQLWANAVRIYNSIWGSFRDFIQDELPYDCYLRSDADTRKGDAASGPSSRLPTLHPYCSLLHTPPLVFSFFSGVWLTGTGGIDSCEPPCESWQWKPGLLEEYPVFLTAEPFAQSFPFIWLLEFGT